MKEIGILNQDIARIISCMGHTDELIVSDAGFIQPPGVEVIDLSVKENDPTVLEVLEVLAKYFAVEELVLSKEAFSMSPTRMDHIVNDFWKDAKLTKIPHGEFRKRAKTVRAIVRTADFTAMSNVLLVSGPGERWFIENPE